MTDTMTNRPEDQATRVGPDVSGLGPALSGRLEALGAALPQFLKWGLVAFGALYILFFLLLAVNRSLYPFHISTLEGAAMIRVDRLFSGEKMFVEPSPDHVSFIYQPLFYYLSALTSLVFGKGYFAFRLVSILAAIGTFVLIHRTIRRETGDWFAGVIGIGFFAGTYALTRGFFDLARVDMLLAFFLMAALYFLLQEGKRAAWLAGLMFAGALMSKQTALLAFIPLAVQVLAFDRNRAIPLLAGAIAPVTAAIVILQGLTDGWYLYYTYTLPSLHRTGLSADILDFWLIDLLPVWIAIALSLFLLVFPLSGFGNLRRYTLLLALVAGYFGMTWASMINPGANLNVLIPAFGLLAVLLGFAVHRMGSLAGGLPEGYRSGTTVYVYALVAAQFALLFYNPAQFWVRGADAETGRQIVAELRDAEAGTYMPFQNYLSIMAGREPGMNGIAFCELAGCFGAPEPVQFERVRRMLAEGVAAGEITALMYDPERIPEGRFAQFDQVLSFEEARRIEVAPGTFAPMNSGPPQTVFLKPTVKPGVLETE